MKWNVSYSDKAFKQLKKLDLKQRTLVAAWIEKNLVGCENPRSTGKQLKGEYENWWRYRVGNYRILAEIQNEELNIMLVQVGHRKEIYKH